VRVISQSARVYNYNFQRTSVFFVRAFGAVYKINVHNWSNDDGEKSNNSLRKNKQKKKKTLPMFAPFQRPPCRLIPAIGTRTDELKVISSATTIRSSTPVDAVAVAGVLRVSSSLSPLYDVRVLRAGWPLERVQRSRRNRYTISFVRRRPSYARRRLTVPCHTWRPAPVARTIVIK